MTLIFGDCECFATRIFSVYINDFLWTKYCAAACWSVKNIISVKVSDNLGARFLAEKARKAFSGFSVSVREPMKLRNRWNCCSGTNETRSRGNAIQIFLWLHQQLHVSLNTENTIHRWITHWLFWDHLDCFPNISAFLIYQASFVFDISFFIFPWNGDTVHVFQKVTQLLRMRVELSSHELSKHKKKTQTLKCNQADYYYRVTPWIVL